RREQSQAGLAQRQPALRQWLGQRAVEIETAVEPARDFLQLGRQRLQESDIRQLDLRVSVQRALHEIGARRQTRLTAQAATGKRQFEFGDQTLLCLFRAQSRGLPLQRRQAGAAQLADTADQFGLQLVQ